MGTEPTEGAEAPADRYADASDLVRSLRRFDRAVGLVEQAVLVVLLATVILVPLVNLGAFWATNERVFEHGDLMSRYAVFGIAMVGGAFAAHHQRLLSLDLVSKKLSAKGRAVLRVVLALFAVAMCGLMVQQSLAEHARASAVSKATGLLTDVNASLWVPIGMGLLALHLVIQAVVELDYLARGKAGPDPEQGAA